ncbi:MAG: glycosyltransferase family 4 protein [Nitrospirae bacterium]|nr:glycosyltransferase family 4 protein [Nitrospirota bacterium]
MKLATVTHNILFVFFLSLTLSALSSFLVSRYGYKISIVDLPNERSSHSTPTPRGGGIGIWIAYTLTGLFVFKNASVILVTSSIGLLGLLDDCFNLSIKLRLTTQIICATIAVYAYKQISLLSVEIIILLLFVFFIVGTANFYNFMDGINGIAGLAGLVAFGLISLFSYYIAHDFDITLMCISLSSACLGFLPFNLPNARVFMGDVGSLLLGFVFALFVIKLSVSVNSFMCLVMFLCVFYADAITTIFYRYKRGENLMQAHRKHLYQYLSNEFGFIHWQIALLYAVIQLLFGLISLFSYTKGFLWQITVIFIFNLMFLSFYRSFIE